MPVRGIYLDECVNHEIIPDLRRRGFTIITAQAEGMFAAEDDDQIRHAYANAWLLLTVNEKDFIAWHRTFQQNQWMHYGIMTVPQTEVIPRLLVRCAMMLDWIVAEIPDPRNNLFRWTNFQQRLIHGYMSEGYTADEIALALGRMSSLQ